MQGQSRRRYHLPRRLRGAIAMANLRLSERARRVALQLRSLGLVREAAGIERSVSRGASFAVSIDRAYRSLGKVVDRKVKEERRLFAALHELRRIANERGEDAGQVASPGHTCSFCHRKQVKAGVAGTDVFICRECIQKAADSV